jgi:hypothetical protein
MSTSQDWEALPQRKKSKRSSDHDSSSTPAPVPSASRPTRNIPKQLDLINQAVSARAHANRAVATLDSGDGCAGENFECSICLFSSLDFI